MIRLDPQSLIDLRLPGPTPEVIDAMARAIRGGITSAFVTAWDDLDGAGRQPFRVVVQTVYAELAMLAGARGMRAPESKGAKA